MSMLQVSAQHLQAWAALGARIRPSEGKRLLLGIEALGRVRNVGCQYAAHRKKHLEKIIDRSNLRFAPIGDPLCITFSLNRWLSVSGEVAYSDWLAWLLQELRSARSMRFLLFGERGGARPDAERYTVDREVWVAEGHSGHAGRLDCVVTFIGQAVVALELKTATTAERSDTAKHEGYLRELGRRHEPIKKAILLASSDEDMRNFNGFDLLTWKKFCTRARILLIELLKETVFYLDRCWLLL